MHFRFEVKGRHADIHDVIPPRSGKVCGQPQRAGLSFRGRYSQLVDAASDVDSEQREHGLAALLRVRGRSATIALPPTPHHAARLTASGCE